MSLITEKKARRPVVEPAGRMEGRAALITGGTRGIGLAVAKAYVAEGAKVVIAARTGSELKEALETLKEMGGEATGVKIDLASFDACRSLHRAAIRAYGRVDVLVNNAGILGPRKEIINYPPEDWEAVMHTNLDAVFWMCKIALGNMIPENGGSIITVSSGVASKGRGMWGAYSVSKAAIENLSEVLADEVNKYNVRVNCVNPGATRTMMRAEAHPREDPSQLPAPEDIVNPFIYLGCDASKGVTGSVLNSRDWMGRTF